MVTTTRIAALLLLLQFEHVFAEAVDEIIVTASRENVSQASIAAATSVVDVNGAAGFRPGLGVEEALVAVPGLVLQNRQNFAQDLRVAVRGFGARSSFGIRGLTLLLDGAPISLPDGQGQVDLVDPAAIARIEVMRGTAGLLYGNAAGGVINFLSRQRSAGLELDSAFGSDGFRRFSVAGSGGRNEFDYQWQIGTLANDGYRDHSRTEQHRARAVFDWGKSTASRWQLALIATDQPLAEDPGGISATDAAADPSSARDRNVLFDSGESQSQWRADLRWQRDLANGELTWRSYAQAQDFANRLPFVGGGRVVFDRELIGSSLVWRQATGEDSVGWLLGLDAGKQADDRSRFDNEEGTTGTLALRQDESVQTLGLFVQRRWRLAARATLNTGARLDYLQFEIDDRFLADGDQSGDQSIEDWSTRFALHYDLTDSQSLFFSRGESFESPTLTEFSNPAGGGFNPQLDPANSVTWELGWRQRVAAQRLELVAFQIDLEDELVGFELASEPGRTFFENAGRSRRNGVELSLSGALGEQLQYRVAGTWTDYRFRRFESDGDDFAGSRLPGEPRLRGGLVVDWRPSPKWTIGIDLEYTGQRFADNANATSVGSHMLLAFRAGYLFSPDTPGLALFAGINNVGDRNFTDNLRINAFGGRFFEPGAGRHYYAGLRWRFAGER